MIHWPKPGFMFPEVKSANCAVPDKAMLYPQRKGDKVKTLLSPRNTSEVRRAKRKEERNNCQSRRDCDENRGSLESN